MNDLTAAIPDFRYILSLMRDRARQAEGIVFIRREGGYGGGVLFEVAKPKDPSGGGCDTEAGSALLCALSALVPDGLTALPRKRRG
jgi:hypothetical protein